MQHTEVLIRRELAPALNRDSCNDKIGFARHRPKIVLNEGGVDTAAISL